MFSVKLDKPLTFDDGMSPICLPKSSQSIPTDGYAVATGYGKTNFGVGMRMQREKAPKESLLELFQNLHIICAGSMGHAVSNGDSGGPLMMKSEDGRWFQIGVSSFG
ncbi:hypothetical protein PMAYCL1PPCAC_26797, partial [Pristionchus mayeri]